jgi:hypothetical protein
MLASPDDAVSVASTLLRTEATMTEIAEEKQHVPGPEGYGE